MDKIKILLADDVKIMRSLLKSSLSTFDVEIVSEVDNGDDVIHKVSELMPDMVFLDISMPGKNGLDVLQEIKEKYSNVFVAMISGHNTFENIKRSMELGADGFVVKPYTTIKIQEMIEKYQAG
ncbi:MAG: response regulator [Gammaproteobacteria bacterium]|jgi:two-component system, chemotaxis family, chemotaxis protein CheY